MHRTGLTIALAVAAIVGLVFAIWPRLDLNLAALFFDAHRGGFWRSYDPLYLFARDASTWAVALVTAPAGLAIANPAGAAMSAITHVLASRANR